MRYQTESCPTSLPKSPLQESTKGGARRWLQALRWDSLFHSPSDGHRPPSSHGAPVTCSSLCLGQWRECVQQLPVTRGCSRLTSSDYKVHTLRYTPQARGLSLTSTLPPGTHLRRLSLKIRVISIFSASSPPLSVFLTRRYVLLLGRRGNATRFMPGIR